MAKAGAGRRQRGSIRRRGNSFQVLVYAGLDPLTGQRMYLSESTTDEAEARRILTRLRAEVESQQQARTRATLGATLDAWLKVHEVEDNTRQGYEAYIRKHIKPALGHVPVGKVTAKMLEDFYAELRRCRARCDGRPMVDHRVEGPHECRVVRHRRPPGRPPAGGHPAHDCAAAGCVVVECPPHSCRPLSRSTIWHVHFAISAALAAAVPHNLYRRGGASRSNLRGDPSPASGGPTENRRSATACGGPGHTTTAEAATYRVRGRSGSSTPPGAQVRRPSWHSSETARRAGERGSGPAPAGPAR